MPPAFVQAALFSGKILVFLYMFIPLHLSIFVGRHPHFGFKLSIKVNLIGVAAHQGNLRQLDISVSDESYGKIHSHLDQIRFERKAEDGFVQGLKIGGADF